MIFIIDRFDGMKLDIKQMAIYQAPELDETDRAVLDLIDGQKERLKTYTQNAPSRWLGSLRRSTFARAIQGSDKKQHRGIQCDVGRGLSRG